VHGDLRCARQEDDLRERAISILGFQEKEEKKKEEAN
jgi:hypothetical protein